MFAGGAVGPVGLLLPLHATNDPIASAIASHLIVPPGLFIWISKRAVLHGSFAAV
jgi:hypothetical protein